MVKKTPIQKAIIKNPVSSQIRSRGRIRKEGTFFPVPPSLRSLPADYVEVLADLKRQIASAQTRAVLSVNREVMALYWRVGGTIVLRQTISGWGEAVVERLAYDLRQTFPGLEGFSPRNIWRMRAFFLAWSGVPKKLTQTVSEMKKKPVSGKLTQVVSESQIRSAIDNVPSVVSEIPWGQNIIILQQIKDQKERVWYARQTCDNGWSRSILQKQIKKNVFGRQGKATTNFSRVLPSPQSELAQLALKDPYNFDFLTMTREAHERVTENELLAHVREFLIELGAGFAFVGSQVKLTVDDSDYYLDLLFYHVRLRCYVVVELKTVAFKPEHAGKLNFYLSAVDDLLKHADDQPSIGLLLCRSRTRMRVEYALRDIHKPIGVAGWKTKLVENLPENFLGSLPTVEELESEFSE